MKKLLVVSLCLTLSALFLIAQAENYSPAGLTSETPHQFNTTKKEVNPTDDWPIVNSFSLAAISNPTGITYDGQVFWVTNYTASASSDIKRVDPATGIVLSFIPSPDYWPCGIAFDGTNLWVHDFVVGHSVYPTVMSMCKVDTATGAVLEMHETQYTSYSGGLCWDGQYVYYGVRPATIPGPCYIYRFDPLTGNDELFLDLGTTGIYGLEYHAGHFFYSDPSSMMYYKITLTGTVVDQSPAAGLEPAGLAMTDDIYLWNVDNNTDMLYQMLVAAPDLDVTLTPVNPPIQIPAGGGNFNFDLSIENTTSSPITSDVWVDVTPPGGAPIPVIIRTGIVFPANTVISRPGLTQSIPGGAPVGEYTYTCTVGEIFGAIIDFDQFYFEKLAVGDGSPAVHGWNLSGWEEVEVISTKPETFSFAGAYPNPFNPTTTLSFTLPTNQRVSLSVFDVSGRQIAQLVDGYRSAGSHEVTFDASHLASGVYFAQIQAGDNTSVQKLLLTK
ncbi:T9SS type A sorting domain-containing protein [bacterium]|nr:T9SS type A sorting domain-containing protein [bacterium]